MAATISARSKKKPTRSADKPSPDGQSPEPRPWYASTFALAMVGSVLLYLAFPPIGWWPLAWVAPIPWLLLIRAERLPSRRPYRWLYLAGFLHWLVLIQWVRLGHWAAHFGWVALSLYVAVYLPLFIGLSRVATKQFRVPLVIAAPAIWVGLECLRGWLFTGLSIALLGHTQIARLPIVQISDLVGAYGVSFVVMLVAAALAELIPLRWIWPKDHPPSATHGIRWWPLPIAVALVVAAVGYGYWRMGQSPANDHATEAARIALIQGSIDTNFHDRDLNKKMYEQYQQLTAEALRQRPDAIVWPESTMPLPMIDIDRGADGRGMVQKGRWLPQDDKTFNEDVDFAERRFHEHAYALGHIPQEQRHVPLLLGASTLRLGDHPPQRLNSAIFIDEDGRVVGAYDKLHPVMFGEYAPGGKLFPWIYELMPIPEGLTPGEKPVAIEIAGLQMCPSICYENTVPHLIRRQVVELKEEGVDPDVLITLSNDGWFYGSAELDMHLICGQFRAIEMRKPALIAANTGISAHIADDGRLLQLGPRRATDVIIAQVRPAARSSLYTHGGDWLANACIMFCCVCGVGGWMGRRTSRGPTGESTTESAQSGSRGE